MNNMNTSTMAQFIAYAERMGLMQDPFEKVYAMFVSRNNNKNN